MSDPRLDILNRYAEKAGELLPDAARELHDALSTHLEPDWEHSASMPSPGEVMHPDYGDEPHHTLLLQMLHYYCRDGKTCNPFQHYDFFQMMYFLFHFS